MKRITFIMHLVLLLTVLVGCGSDSDAGNPEAGLGASTSESVAPTTQAALEPETETSEEKQVPSAEPLSLEQIDANLTKIMANEDSATVAKTMITYPSLPNPEGATINSYDAEVSTSLSSEEDADVRVSFEVFTGLSAEESVAFYVSEMEKAGWEIKPENPDQNTDSSTVLSATPANWPGAFFEITVHGAVYRGEVLAVIEFLQNGTPYGDVGSPETWSEWYKDQIFVPEGGSVTGGGAGNKAVPTGNQENISTEDGDTLVVSLAYPDKTDDELRAEILELAPGAGFEVVSEGDSLVMTNSKVEVVYRFSRVLDSDPNNGGVRAAARYLN